jgi:di/tripeptidase
MSHPYVPPSQNVDTLSDWGTDNLTRVIAVDSQSDAASDSVPSTEGQRQLAELLSAFFVDLGYASRLDGSANLVVEVPSNMETDLAPPTIALMVHLDTAEGTLAVPSLDRISGWRGDRIPYRRGPHLNVSLDSYETTRPFLGEDVLYGPGDAPIGLDDKLGMCQLMTLAQALRANPGIPHGRILLVFRPDEEIGREEAIVALAETLHGEQVRCGYTVDGIYPFEVNTDNFHASSAQVEIQGRPLALDAPMVREVTVTVHGVKSHGATAKEEGYLNATVVLAHAMARLDGRDDIIPVAMHSNSMVETDGDVTFLVTGSSETELEETTQTLMDAIEAILAPHAGRGASVERRDQVPPASHTDAMVRVVAHLRAFLGSDGPQPRLSEESDGWQGYSNPHFIRSSAEGDAAVTYRLRDFDRERLTDREREILGLGQSGGHQVTISQQYENMGAALADSPELVVWATQAAQGTGAQADRRPIRGGTGVDPFIAKGIPVANLGTGYFAPESEKELTSVQSIGRHSLWLLQLVQEIARHPAPTGP